MTKYGPASAFIIVENYDLSPDSYQMEEEVESLLEQTNGLSTSMEEHTPIGLARATLKASGGLYDDSATGIISVLQAKGATAQLAIWGLEGRSAGAHVRISDGDYAAKFKRIASRDGITKAHAEHVLSGRLYEALLAHGETAETTASGDTESASMDQNLNRLARTHPIVSSAVSNPCQITAPGHGLITGDVIYIVDHSGSTPDINGEQTVTYVSADVFTLDGVNCTVGGTGGYFRKLTSTNGVGQLHVQALTLGGYTNVTIKLRDSADDITFADLATFTAVAAVVAERITITGDIQRYTAMSWLFNGAGSGMSITPIVAIGRDD